MMLNTTIDFLIKVLFYSISNLFWLPIIYFFYFLLFKEKSRRNVILFVFLEAIFCIPYYLCIYDFFIMFLFVCTAVKFSPFFILLIEFMFLKKYKFNNKMLSLFIIVDIIVIILILVRQGTVNPMEDNGTVLCLAFYQSPSPSEWVTI